MSTNAIEAETPKSQLFALAEADKRGLFGALVRFVETDGENLEELHDRGRASGVPTDQWLKTLGNLEKRHKAKLDADEADEIEQTELGPLLAERDALTRKSEELLQRHQAERKALGAEQDATAEKVRLAQNKVDQKRKSSRDVFQNTSSPTLRRRHQECLAQLQKLNLQKVSNRSEQGSRSRQILDEKITRIRDEANAIKEQMDRWVSVDF